MLRLKLILGIIWSSPITLVGVILQIIPLLLAKQVKFLGWDEVAWTFVTVPGTMLHRYMEFKWAGYCVGNVVVYQKGLEPSSNSYTDWAPPPTPTPTGPLRLHELEHVKQCMRLGIFQPIIYALSWIGIYLGSIETHPYHDNPFEIAARRAAGQQVDRGTRLHRWKLGSKEVKH